LSVKRFKKTGSVREENAFYSGGERSRTSRVSEGKRRYVFLFWVSRGLGRGPSKEGKNIEALRKEKASHREKRASRDEFRKGEGDQGSSKNSIKVWGGSWFEKDVGLKQGGGCSPQKAAF